MMKNGRMPTTKFLRNYTEQVLDLFMLQRAIRDGDWLAYLEMLECFSPYFFVDNCHDYALYIPEFLARMQELKSEDKEAWNDLLMGAFTANIVNSMDSGSVDNRNDGHDENTSTCTSGVKFTRIGLEQAHEHTIKRLKGDGGICGLTSDPTTLYKYCITAPVISAISHEAERLIANDKSSHSPDKHHQDNQR